MRVTTQMLFQNSLARLNEQQSALLKTQQEIATGRRVVTPSDDPVAAAQIVGLTASDARTGQYVTNRDYAKNAVSLQESVLANVGNIVQDAQTAVISAGNATYGDSERKFLATELRGRLQELLALANTVDSDGQAIFSGYDGGRKPFATIAGNIQYQGDGGSRYLQVADGRQMPITVSGQTVFETIRTGNGKFTTAVTPGNTGSGVVSVGSVVDPTLLTGHDYRINFSVAGAVTTYDVVDTSTGATLSSGNPYASGNAITFDGIQFDVSGSPANGDSVTVAPSANQSVFKTLENLISALETPVVGPTGQAQLRNQLNSAHAALGNALDNVLSVRAAAGGRLNELDSLDSAGQDLSLQYQKTLSELRDTDYNEAVSRLSRQQVGLQAAQQTFTKIAGLSLFNYL